MMGWSNCGEDEDGRPIGYGIEATCDQPECETQIDRGLSYVCGHMHGGGEYGCGRYFCNDHLYFKTAVNEQLCGSCLDDLELSK